MSAVPSASIEDVSAALPKALHGVEHVSDAWVSFQQDTYDVWLLIEPLDLTAERELYALEDPLYERFPGATFSLHILNPQTFVDLVPEAIVPAGAYHVGVSASA
jgi:hypothetical protein